jgi:hypothetical protein
VGERRVVGTGGISHVDLGQMPGAVVDACGTEYGDSDPRLVFQAWAKVKKGDGNGVILHVTLDPAL